jgi:phytoene dehydrogenase-like protein
MGGMMPPVLRSFLNRLDWGTKRLVLSPTADVLCRRFNNPELISLLCSQWGDYGLPPSQSAFLIHAVIVNHYLEGGYYPAGGAGVIAESVRPLVERSGGAFLVNHEVTAVIVEKGRARGVRAVERRGAKTLEKEFLAATVISDAGATTTYSRLLSRVYAEDARRDLNSLPSPTAHVCLHVGFKDDPGKLGFHGENHWIYNSLDHEEIFRLRNELLEGRPMACFLSFPSMKGGVRGHTAEIISFLDYEPFRLWRDKPWKHRGDDYEDLKERISRALIDFVDQRYPGFSALVDFRELSTPLTTEYFTGHPHGAAYGLPAVPERFQMRWTGPGTPVKGLYLAGADAACVGVVGAMMGGVSAAGLVMGWRGLWRLFHAVGKRVKAVATGFRG